MYMSTSILKRQANQMLVACVTIQTVSEEANKTETHQHPTLSRFTDQVSVMVAIAQVV